MNWIITQNIFFSMMSDRKEINYYDTTKGVVVGYMDEYLVPLSQDMMEAFKLCMERAERNEPADLINPSVHKQIPILKTADFIKTIDEVISLNSNQEFRKLKQSFEKSIKHFESTNKDFASTNLSTKLFKEFLDNLTREVNTTKIGDPNLINLLYKETAEIITNKFVSA